MTRGRIKAHWGTASTAGRCHWARATFPRVRCVFAFHPLVLPVSRRENPLSCGIHSPPTGIIVFVPGGLACERRALRRQLSGGGALACQHPTRAKAVVARGAIFEPPGCVACQGKISTDAAVWSMTDVWAVCRTVVLCSGLPVLDSCCAVSGCRWWGKGVRQGKKGCGDFLVMWYVAQHCLCIYYAS